MSTNSLSFEFDNSYARLPENFFCRLRPTPVHFPKLIRINKNLAMELKIDPDLLSSEEGVKILAGNKIPTGADPLAMAYAGHQFGNWVPQLGDGRAILLGELIDINGIRRDLQLKGCGITPFSRMGDGRAAVGPIIREFMVSEAMNALNIDSTRSLAAISTGNFVVRENIHPGAILTRVAKSHVRVGTFQFFASRGDIPALQSLADYVISRLYPIAKKSENPYLSLLNLVIEKQARLIAKWQLIGFIHGVMNTDNMSISGETIDFGPCAFMDFFHPDTVYSSIDELGRYAYKNQPYIAQWNLACFAETLLPLISSNEEKATKLAQESVNSFTDLFDAEYLAHFRKKLGLFEEDKDDLNLGTALLECMQQNKTDFTLTFRYLSCLKRKRTEYDTVLHQLFENKSSLDVWLARWRKRLDLEQVSDSRRIKAMQSVNPAFIPRNHMIETIIESAIDNGDFTLFNNFLCIMETPYNDQLAHDRFFQPPRPDEIIKATFCGT
ncbi:MAG: hypothetical protein CFH06_01017 [Alphaproteobacteria bacterium MarineAlpha3_Bin5]|nr:hypothetical protein [Magnetovibrio sp.]PPR77960.1 MAG: hypothetical protein CFH06_01017 [Alphaproteobacteria bacterium MarineAlpha3_Bin5]